MTGPGFESGAQADSDEAWRDELLQAVALLAELSQRDDRARAAIGALGRALSALATPPAASAPAPGEVTAPTPPTEEPTKAVLDVREMIRAALSQLDQGDREMSQIGQAAGRLVGEPPSLAGRPRAPELMRSSAVSSPPPILGLDIQELRDLAAAFHGKSRASSWAAARRESAPGALHTIPPEISGSLDIDRQLWFCDHRTLDRYPARQYRQLAASFDVIAAALNLVVLTWQESGEENLFRPVQMLAEAQCMVRTAADEFGKTDPEQERTHQLLRRITADLRIYVPQFMRLTDRADPESARDLAARIQAEAAPLRARQQREIEYREARSRLDYHLESLAEDGLSEDERHWNEVLAAMEVLVGGGVLRPSDRELRERLLPLLDGRPATIEVGPGVSQVLREIDRYLASQETTEAEPAGAAPPPPDVQRVARLLGGRAVVLIGGERRVEHQERIERVFELSELVWLEGYGRPYTSFQRHIAREDVALVLLAVRWASHESMNVQKYCDEYQKPLVLLRAGYNENQVAAQVLAQAGQRLERQQRLQ